MKHATLHVIAVISNPQRYETRYDLYNKFAKHVEDSGAKLWTVETAFGDRPHEITASDHSQHIQLRTSTELWHKENMINIGISRLPANWEYVAWIDADVTFARPDWALETLHQLQHYKVVQMFSDCMDLSPDYRIVPDRAGEHLPGMMHQYIHTGGWSATLDAYKAHSGHSGYAWAARREAIDEVGGLIDWSVCGANDHHMARGLVGNILESVHGGSSPAFKKSLQVWGDRCRQHIRGNVGYVPGLLLHHWHGSKKYRRYIDRWKILNNSQFDPNIDIKKDSQGLYQLTGNKLRLRDDLMTYFRQRNEDCIRVD